jgi:site-specific DNA recombinase
LIAFLRDESRLMAAMGDVDAGIARNRIQAGAALTAALESEAAGRRIEVLKRVLARVIVKSECIEVAVHTAMISASQGQRCADDPTTLIVVPARLKRCGLAVRLIVEGQTEAKTRGPDPGLIALVAKAHRWFSALNSGQHSSVLAIANEQGMEGRDVTRILYLAFLAPDIVQRIVRGEQPMGLSTKRLLAQAPFPLLWHEQRRLLGFGS